MDNKKLATTLETDLNNAVFALGRLTGLQSKRSSGLKSQAEPRKPSKRSRRGPCKKLSPSTLTVASAQTHTQTLALRTGILSSQRRQSRSLARASFSGRAERESCLRTRSKPAPDGAYISTL